MRLERKKSTSQRKRRRNLKKKLEDSRFVKIVEKLPVLGFAASAGHSIAAVVTGMHYGSSSVFVTKSTRGQSLHVAGYTTYY